MSFRVGVAQVNITPPIGVWMTGFAGRAGPAIGVHDELYAKALVVEVGTEQAALVSTDLLSLDFATVRKTRALVNEWTGIPPDHVLINSSHTHSGPATIRLRALGDVDEAYVDVLVRKIATAMKMAQDNLQPARMSWGKEHVRIGINRREKRPDGTVELGRNSDGPIDPNVYVLRFDNNNNHGQPFALLFCYAAHPVVLGGNNRYISADYPGFAVRTIRRALGDECTALFMQGCCGNINSERVGADFAECERLGSMLGAAAVKAALLAEPVGVDTLKVRQRDVRLPLEEPPSMEEAEKILSQQEESLRQAELKGDMVQIQIAQGLLEWAKEVERAAQEGKRERSQPMEVQAVRLGDVAIVGEAAEVFIELALDTMKRSPFERTVVLGYTNGCIGYLPTAAAYEDGGYEVSGAIRFYGSLMIAPESERLVTDAAVDMLRELAVG